MSVMVAHLHSGDSITGAFAASLDAVYQKGETKPTFPPTRVQSGFDVHKGRNLATEFFLSQTEDWLWMVDDDMAFGPDILDKLLAVADPEERPVVGGLCFTQRANGYSPTNATKYQSYPTIYRYDSDRDEFQIYEGGLPGPTEVGQVDATGAGCLLIHRDVFMRMIMDQWWDPVDPDWSEDLSFCYRLKEAGVPIHIHYGAETAHRKIVWLDREEYENQ